MAPGKYVYFVSDVHLGVPSHEASLARERKLVDWLSSIEDSAEAIHIVGDLFDFWFEYATVVPRGFVRVLGKLASIRDRGIPVYMYTGNHDLWMFDYFEKELGIPVYRAPREWEYSGSKFLVGHGDGVGPGDHGYKFIKKVFTSKLCQWLFARLHPNFGIGLALFWSRKSREADAHIDESFQCEKEAQVIYSREQIAHKTLNFIVFGHRHCPTVYPLNEESTFVNLGDWITHFTFGRFDGKKIELKSFSDTTIGQL